MRLTIYFLIILPLIIFVSKPSYSGEDAVLLAMKLECGGNSAGRKPYNDYFLLCEFALFKEIDTGLEKINMKEM